VLIMGAAVTSRCALLFWTTLVARRVPRLGNARSERHSLRRRARPGPALHVRRVLRIRQVASPWSLGFSVGVFRTEMTANCAWLLTFL
jgi:hypothetical protein